MEKEIIGERRFLIEPIQNNNNNNNNKVHFTQREKFTGSMVESLEGWRDYWVTLIFDFVGIIIGPDAIKNLHN